MRIGIITVPDPAKGLHREAELIAWALSKSSSLTIEVIHLNTILTDSVQMESVPSLEPTKWSVLSNGSIANWLDSLDTLFVLEAVNKSIIEYAISKMKIVYVPNLEWAMMKVEGQESVKKWVETIQEYVMQGLIVIAKTKNISKILSLNKIESLQINWSIPDEIQQQSHNNKSTKKIILMNAGHGGWNSRRGVDIYVEAIKAMPNNHSFIFMLKTIKPWGDYNLGPRPEALKLVEGFLPRKELDNLINSIDLIIYPSRFEGFGLSMLEALHCGIPVMCTDGWPMNEIQTISDRLLHIEVESKNQLRLAFLYEPSPKSIVRNLIALESINLKERFPLRLVTKDLKYRQQRFVIQIQSLC